MSPQCHRDLFSDLMAPQGASGLGAQCQRAGLLEAPATSESRGEFGALGLVQRGSINVFHESVDCGPSARGDATPNESVYGRTMAARTEKLGQHVPCGADGEVKG